MMLLTMVEAQPVAIAVVPKRTTQSPAGKTVRISYSGACL